MGACSGGCAGLRIGKGPPPSSARTDPPPMGSGSRGEPDKTSSARSIPSRSPSIRKLPPPQPPPQVVEVVGAGSPAANGRYELKHTGHQDGRPCYAMVSGSHEYQLRTAHPYDRWAIIRRDRKEPGKYRVVYTVYATSGSDVPEKGWHVREGEFASGCDIGEVPFPVVASQLRDTGPDTARTYATTTTQSTTYADTLTSWTTGRPPLPPSARSPSTPSARPPELLEVSGGGCAGANGRYRFKGGKSRQVYYEMVSDTHLYQVVFLPITWWVIARHDLDGPPMEKKFLGYARPFSIVYAAPDQGPEVPQTGWRTRKGQSASGFDIGEAPNPIVRPAPTAPPDGSPHTPPPASPRLQLIEVADLDSRGSDAPLASARFASEDGHVWATYGDAPDTAPVDTSDSPPEAPYPRGRECPICFEPLARFTERGVPAHPEQREPKVLAPCGHVICVNCADLPTASIGRPCPICRACIRSHVKRIYEG